MSDGQALRILIVQGPLVLEQLSVFRACARLGVQIRVIGHSGPHPDKWWSDPAADDTLVESLTPVRVHKGHRGWLYRGLVPRVRQFAPDVIHVGSEPWGLLVEQALWTGRPVVSHGAENQNYDHGRRQKALLRRMLAERHLPRLAGFASWNQAGIGLALEHGLSPHVPVMVAPGELSDPAPFLEAGYGRASGRARLGMDDRVRYVGFVGRLAPEKGLQHLIDAVAALDRKDVELVVAGVGPAQREMEARSRSVGIRARFLGLVALSQIPEVMASVDVMAVPSITTPGLAEQFGRVAVESMFAGTPLVVTNSGSLPEVVEDAAIVVPEQAPGSLAEAIGRILDDPGFARDLAQSARENALRRFHPDRLAGDFVGFWNQVALRDHPSHS